MTNQNTDDYSIPGAREAFEKHKRALWAKVIAKSKESGMHEDNLFVGRLRINDDGRYYDINDRLDFMSWCYAWKAALEWKEAQSNV